jgi:diadenosine tetraphosphate (Ap4A) HIT family hydrolase
LTSPVTADRGDCFICGTIRASDAGTNPGFVAKLRTGYVVLNTTGQYYPGYTIFQSRRCVPELHELPARARDEFLREMASVAEAVFRAFRPAKLNYELLGNTVPHLHWHLIPRYPDDPLPLIPAWENPAFLASLRNRAEPGAAQLGRLKTRLLRDLAEVAGPRIRTTFRDPGA